MSRARPYIAAGLDHQGRIAQTRMQAWEDDAGTCNTCPGELDSAESCFQRDPDRGMPPPVPWRALGAGAAVLFLAVVGLQVAVQILPAAVQVATR